MSSIQPCHYCLRPIDTRGMLAHVHFRHRGYVSREFLYNPTVWVTMWALEGWLPPRLPLALPVRCKSAGRPRKMLAPISKGPRWI